MRWSGETLDSFRARMYDWHTIFAILPHKTMNGSWVWMERVNRRQIKYTLNGSVVWKYVAVGDKLPPAQSASVGKPPSTGSGVRPRRSL